MEQRDCFYATNSLRLSNVVRCCTHTTRRGRLVRSGLVLVRQLIMLAARRLFRPASADQYDAAHTLSRRCAHTAEIHAGWRGVTAAGTSIPLNVVVALCARRETAHRPARHVVDPNVDRTITG